MEPILREIAETIALVCEALAILYVALGAAEAFGRTVLNWRSFGDLSLGKLIWLRFAASLVLALEFALAADIVRSAIAPTWMEIAKLGAIATIRTALNWFLTRDVKAARRAGDAPSAVRKSG